MGAEGTAETGTLIQPDGSSENIYSGIGSALVPAGAVFGETVFIEIESTGGAVLTSGVELNTLYECRSSNRQSSIVFQQARLERSSDNLADWLQSGRCN